MNPISLSRGAKFAIGRLESLGFEAYAVGGCVRDSLLGTVPHDWDLTTNATPDETAAAFADCRVIGTGMKHGTVAILYMGEQLEITTYRLDGDYADNRHPSSVTFSKSLSDDLSRRDFTVNAMAYHPARGLTDLFGGTDDLDRRLIRCVGDAETRFHEDGLRILRAVRFASALDFSLEPETSRAVHACVSLLENIAPERIREEWSKLLLGKAVDFVLHEYPDVTLRVFPDASRSPIAVRIADAPADLVTRLTVFFYGWMTDTGSDAAMRRLRFDRATREEVGTLLRLIEIPVAPTTAAVRRLLAELSPETFWRLLDVKRCFKAPVSPKVAHIAQTVLSRGDCLSLRTLAVNGKDLMKIGIPEGKPVGEVLDRLLDAVLDGSLPNRKAALLNAAKEWR